MKETLEDAAERLYPNGCDGTDRSAEIYRRIFIEGAKWQQERSYSEEDMRKAYCRGYGAIVRSSLNDCFYEWFEQFKKK
jgi:hypothetical protein